MCKGALLHEATSAHDDAFAACPAEPVPIEPKALSPRVAAPAGALSACSEDAVPEEPSPSAAVPESCGDLRGRQAHEAGWRGVCAGSLRSASTSGAGGIMRKVGRLHTDDELVGRLHTDDELVAQGALACDPRRVRLHVYDVEEGGIQRLNRLLTQAESPVKLGGVFHVGVQVYGVEWAFGFAGDASTGVWGCAPQGNPQHCFRETLELGETRVSRSAFAGLMVRMRGRYPGKSYNLLHNNCCNFAEDLCQRLGVAPVPMWVNRFARIGASMDNIVHLRGPPRRSSSATAKRNPPRELVHI